MIVKSKWVIFSLFVLLALAGNGQSFSAHRSKEWKVDAEWHVLDSLSIDPTSIYVHEIGKTDTLMINFNFETSSVKIDVPIGTVVHADYLAMSVNLGALYQHLVRDSLGTLNYENPFNFNSFHREDKASLDIGDLQKNGSISRGINVGNNQDLSVNSNMNFQIAGKLTDRINIVASVSDDNLPIQPDGNTQQLQEFDRVFIELFNDRSKLIAGDYRVINTDHYFLKYNKKAQGGTFQTAYQVNQKWKGQSKVSAALSRGKFARNIVQGVEGNQGPYRLTGAENERFIIVLSGTERVYIDGKLLTRGQENEYVINYNTAEITFTAKQLITKDKRIVVEYQYSDKNYARSLIQASTSLSTQKLKLDVHYFSEQDAKNQSLQQELSDEQKLSLALTGDSLSDALAPSEIAREFDDNLIMYQKVDTVVNGISRNVLVFTTDPKKATHTASFTFFGANSGDYQLTNTTVNGKVYQWVAPVNGQPQGSFRPVIKLLSPKRQQMVVIGGEYLINGNAKLVFEAAASENDQNLFSDLDDQDNTGTAGNVELVNELPLDGELKYILTNEVGVSFMEKRFTTVERIRGVEFDRNWNVRGMTFTGNQLLPKGSIGVKRDSVGAIAYTFEGLLAGKQYSGYRNSVDLNINRHGFLVSSHSSLMNASSADASRFVKNTSSLSQKIGFITIGARDVYERNAFTNAGLLVPTSYEFLEYEAFIQGADSSNSGFLLNYVDRVDKGVRDNEIRGATHGRSLGLGLTLVASKQVAIKSRSTYRVLEITDETITGQKPDSTLVNRIEYRIKLFKGAVQSNAFYEIGSGLEVKREYTFLEVPSGQGVYVHRDYNENGLKEINEFEISPFGYDANYIKVYTPSSDYVKTYNNQMSFMLNLRPKAIWRSKKGIKGFIARFRNQFAYRLDKKTANSSFTEYADPIIADVGEVLDSSLVSLNKSLRNSIYFNKTHPVYGADFNYLELQNKSLLVYGYDTRSNRKYSYKVRLNVGKRIVITNEQSWGTKLFNSQFFPGKDFAVSARTIKPQIAFQHKSSLRVSVFYDYKNKQNTSEIMELAVINGYGGELKWMMATQGSVALNFSLLSIDYDYPANNALGFEMLEGLQPGMNGVWGLSYQRVIAKNLQLSFNYNGRASKDVPVVHAGGIQVRANF